MPRLLDTNAENHVSARSNYHFSGTRIGAIGASEITLVSIVQDCSGSVSGMAPDLERCLSTALKSCAKSDRADNLMVRLTTFSDGVTEVHGWKEFKNIKVGEIKNAADLGEYAGVIACGGQTALNEAVSESVEVMSAYGSALIAKKYSANGIVFIITDGMNYPIGRGPSHEDIKKTILEAKKAESLESITTILIGIVNNSPEVDAYLKRFVDEVGIDRYIAMADVTRGALAKLALFVSQSVSSSSLALGSGGPSQPVALSI